MASNDDIMRELGELGQAVKQLREDLRDERNVARDNRNRMHARLDQQMREVGEIEEKVIIIGQTLGQQREQMTALSEKVEPSMAEWQRIKTLGWGFSALLLAIGVTGSSFVIWAGDTSVTMLRKWLRID